MNYLRIVVTLTTVALEPITKVDEHISMVLSAPTILWPWVRIPSTPSMLFSICIIEIVTRKEQK